MHWAIYRRGLNSQIRKFCKRNDADEYARILRNLNGFEYEVICEFEEVVFEVG